MWVFAQSNKGLINIDQFRNIHIFDESEGRGKRPFVLKADEKFALGRYDSEKEEHHALIELPKAICEEQPLFIMPE